MKRQGILVLPKPHKATAYKQKLIRSVHEIKDGLKTLFFYDFIIFGSDKLKYIRSTKYVLQNTVLQFEINNYKP